MYGAYDIIGLSVYMYQFFSVRPSHFLFQIIFKEF